jgi:hypothetical protein
MRLACLALGFMLAASADASAQQVRLGASCVRGQYAISGFLLVCGDNGAYRYALHEDIPPAPVDGYTARPFWYPRLGDIFRAANAPWCSITGRVTFTSPVIQPEDVDVIVPQDS